MTQRPTPLSGVRVLSVEQAVAAPLCTRHLADLGADVVKVERPRTGDFARHYDSLVHGYSTYVVWLNRGKRSIVIDLSRRDGQAVFADLAQRADVLVANLSPRASASLIDDELLKGINPDLIRCYISGYGLDGPYRDRKAYDLLIQGEAGITRSTGTADHPSKAGVSLVDLAGGVYAFGAINAALAARARGGSGTRIDIALFDVAVEWMMPLLLTQLSQGSVPPPAGLHHSAITPYGAYRAGDGSLINIAVQNDTQWDRLCQLVLQDPQLHDDARFENNEARHNHRAELERWVQDAVGRLSRAELELRLTRADLPWGDINDVRQVVDHPQLVGRGRWISARLPGGSEVPVVADPIYLNGHAADDGGRLPALGEDTVQVLSQIGYTPDRIRLLLSAGVIEAPAAEGGYRAPFHPGTARTRTAPRDSSR